MLRTADSIRLRAPDGRPLTWRSRPPLRVGFWDATPVRITDACSWAVDMWSTKLGRRLLFPWRGVGRVDVMCGARGVEVAFGQGASGRGSVSDLLRSQRSTAALPGNSEGTFGDCDLYWNSSSQVIAASVFAAPGLSQLDTRAAIAHELGHVLLLGHAPASPLRLMYRTHTGVTRPSRAEVLWVRDIWGI